MQLLKKLQLILITFKFKINDFEYIFIWASKSLLKWSFVTKFLIKSFLSILRKSSIDKMFQTWKFLINVNIAKNVLYTKFCQISTLVDLDHQFSCICFPSRLKSPDWKFSSLRFIPVLFTFTQWPGFTNIGI